MKKNDYIIVTNENVNKIKDYDDLENTGFSFARVIEKVNQKIIARALDDACEKRLISETINTDENHVLLLSNIDLKRNLDQ